MDKILFSTPAENLDISTPELTSKINELITSALISGSWFNPYEDAATSVEEMTVDDMAYWIYKCTNPIINFEKGNSISDVISTQNIVQLPMNFEKFSSLTFGAAGDILQAEGLEFSKDILFENVADLLFEKDISYANFESPVTEQTLVKEIISDRAPPTECCSYEQFNILTEYKGKSFDVLNVANNHIFDMGMEGFNCTLKAFSQKNILPVGINQNTQELGRAKIIICNDIKVGFVSCTFGLNGHTLPTDKNYLVNCTKLLSKYADPDLELIKKQIEDCKSQNCDFIIASLHWGFEFEFFPRRKQIEASHLLIEYGADAIICHHPHVIQPVEYYRTKRDPNRIATIAYSLGSMTWGYTAPHLVLSLIQNLRITKGNFEGRTLTYIEDAAVTPIFRSVTKEGENIITRIEKLQEHINTGTRIHSKEYMDDIYDYAKLVLDCTEGAEALLHKTPAVTYHNVIEAL